MWRAKRMEIKWNASTPGGPWDALCSKFSWFFWKEVIFFSEFLFFVWVIFLERNFHVFLSKMHQPRGGIRYALNALTPGVYVTRYSHEKHEFFYKEVNFF